MLTPRIKLPRTHGESKKPVHGILHITYILFIELLWGDRLVVAGSKEQWAQGIGNEQLEKNRVTSEDGLVPCLPCSSG